MPDDGVLLVRDVPACAANKTVANGSEIKTKAAVSRKLGVFMLTFKVPANCRHYNCYNE